MSQDIVLKSLRSVLKQTSTVCMPDSNAHVLCVWSMCLHVINLYTEIIVYESRDFNHKSSSFESVRICYYSRECVLAISLLCSTSILELP